MKFIKSVHTIDMHTMGEATRIVIGGLPHIKGITMQQKKEFLQKNLDNIRLTLMQEPRGHKDMFGAVITEPVNKEADLGVIFMDGGGYLNMCGHGSIGVVTAVIETGMISAVEPTTNVVIDTPAGTIKAKANVKNGKVESVSIINVESFFDKEVTIDLPNIGKISVDIAFGGSYFALVDADKLKQKIQPRNVNILIELGLLIRKIVNEKIDVEHPIHEHINTVDLVEIYERPSEDNPNYKNVVIFGQGQTDRSPCGTGTSAKLATLFHKGEIKIGEDFVYESILGTKFFGKIVDTKQNKKYNGIIPEITASAYITGFNHFVVDEKDPLKDGFTLG